MKTLACQLKKLHACEEAVEWAKPYGADLALAWAECQRGDWMLWIAGKFSGPPGGDGRKRLVLAACECARLAMPYATSKSVILCIETADLWARGEATKAQLIVAQRAASDAAAYASDVAAYAAAYAAYAAAYAAYAADASANASANAARTKTFAVCADIVRSHYLTHPKETIECDHSTR